MTLGIILIVFGLVIFMGSITAANVEARSSGGFLKTRKSIYIPIFLVSWVIFGLGCFITSS